MREKELVCIGCPLGCSLKVTIQDVFSPGRGRPSAMCICEDRIRYTKRQDI